jgi:signal transduction histidine kinase/xanthosine utilization system XapX-like protein
MMWPRAFATVAAILTAAMLVLAGVLTVVAPTRTALVSLAVGLVVGSLAAFLGVLTTRQPEGAVVGALLSFVGLTVSITVAREVAWQVLADRPDVATSLSWLVAALAEGAWWVLVSVALLLLYFPDGRLPGPRWRWVPGVMITSTIVNQVWGAMDSAPFLPPLENLARPFPEAPFWLRMVSEASFVLMLGLVLASAVSLVLRFRRARGVQRRQITWLALGGFGVALYPVLCLIEILVWGEALWLSAAVGVTAVIGIPVATAIAILRHDLYDVDKALAGAVTWGLVTVLLLAVYASSTIVAGVLLGQESAVAAAGATAICAIALTPLRHRLQRGVDGRLYPLRRAAFSAIDRLHHDAAAGRSTPEQLQPVLRTALRDPGLRVGFRVPGAEGFVDAAGVPVSADSSEPIVLGGTTIGALVAAAGEASPELLRDVANRAATIAEMVRLRLELAQTLREVEASRARLVQIGYDERRRLERDLHDGAQQRLVSLGMAIRLAQRHLDDGTVDVNGLLDQSVAELGTAVAELRQIAHGIRPSSLDDGLPAAVARLVRNVPVTIDLDVDDSQLPDDVATTVYFVISESLANAVKHAEASRIGLSVARLNGQVMVRVSDDGCGGAALRPESGLADRVAALGGSLEVVSPAGRGTVVEAALPCAS